MRIETISGPVRLDGMQRLAGEFIVVGEREAFGELPRIDVGTVEYARPLRHQELTLGQYIAGAAVALVLCVPTCVGLWFMGKAAITFLSGVSR